MKKTYVNPRIRVVEMECASQLMAESIPFGGDSNGGPGEVRRNRWQDDWDDEN